MAHPELPVRRLLLLTVFLPVVAWPGQVASVEPADVEAISDAVKALIRAGRADSSLVLLDAGLEIARERDDERGEIELLVHRGMALKYTEGGAAAESFLEEVLVRARASGDCTLVTAALFQLGQAIDDQGRPPRARAVYEELIERATECDEPRLLGRAHMYLARHDLRAGNFEEAHRRVELALSVFRGSGLEDEIGVGQFLLGVVLVRLGRLDEARARWEESADWARRTGLSPSVLGSSLNNLGRLEMAIGDPSRAAAYWREAEMLLRETARDRAAVTPAKNGALALADLGRHEEALALLEEQRDRADDNGWTDLSEALRVDIADLERKRKRWPEAAVLYRDLLDRVSADERPELRASIAIGYADVLSESDGAAEAVEWLGREREQLGARIEAKQRLDIDAVLGWQLERAGRSAEAESLLVMCLEVADEAGWPRFHLHVGPALARAQSALGRPEDAMATLRRAAKTWESERDVPEDPVWREQRGSLGAEVYTELAALLLDYPPMSSVEERRFAAHDVLQEYKTRTLLERMTGPSTGAPRAPAEPSRTSSAELRRLIPEGAVLLDCFAGPRFSLLFVVSADGIDAHRLPAAPEARAALEQYRDLVRGNPTSVAWRESARFVRESLLAGVLEELPAGARVLWSADGPWHLLPLATLPVEGAPLLARHEIVRIPSLAVLARVQRTPTETRPAHMMAIAGALDADGNPLPGADREVAYLATRFRNVEVRRGRAAVTNGIDRGGVLHVAAHTEVDDRRPWRSGFALGSAPGDEIWLRATDVARTPLDVGLAVLSGCETAGGRVLSGEGVIGLTGAFLAAGVPVVVSSTWPVRDRATVDLMTGFYDRLAAGESVAEALRGAQLERSEAGAPPDEWAAFVVVGNGDLVVPIERRRAAPPPAVLLATGIAGLLVAWRLRTGSRVAETRPTVVP